MFDEWKQRLKSIAPWVLFLGMLLAWIADGFKGPPPTPPLLQQVADSQAETLSRVKAIEGTLGAAQVEIK
jgi:hypothetical protein